MRSLVSTHLNNGEPDMKLVRLSPLVFAALAITFSPAVRAQAQTVSFIADFNGTDGDEPNGPLVQATDGDLYGATPVTSNNEGDIYAGLVFKVAPTGKLSVFYNFCTPDCNYGPWIHSSPILGGDGNFYGLGGSDFYRLTPGGEYTTLYTFCSDEGCPAADAFILGSDGNFYGASVGGGKYELGDIVRITPTGELTLLYSLCSRPNCKDGAYGNSPIIQASNGNLYGTTGGGGTLGGGVIYELSLSRNYKIIHNFCDSNNGACPEGSFPTSVVQDANGNFFGTAATGGKWGAGTFFEITAKNQFVVLHDFTGTEASYTGGLTLGSDGNFYGVGVTGKFYYGTIFEMTATGRFTSLYTFIPTCCRNSYGANYALFQGTDGSFYGTTTFGPDIYGDGTVYKLSNGLGPLVETVPEGGRVGNSVIILGNGLTGSTSVTFNGVEAAFTVESDTYIKATVPKGATTGTVSVVTPSGTLNSNPQFVVSK
jgi:uncharacterized repeat protein (TIGR03803 family)